MSKHWNPEDELTRVRETSAKRPPLPRGAVPGLLLVAVGCAALVFALDRAFHRPNVFADASAAKDQSHG